MTLPHQFEIETQVAALLARNAAGGQAVTFQIVDKSLVITSEATWPDNRTRVEFQFQGLVDYLGQPTAYLGSGSAVLGPDGRIDPESLAF